MPDLTTIGVIANSLNAAVNITKAMVDLRDWSAVQSKVIEFQQAILEAQGSIFAANEERSALVQRVGELEKEVATLKAWGTEKENYELKRVAVGAFARVVKEGVRGSELIHWLCDNCYQHSKKSILQVHSRDPLDKRTSIYKCGDPQCGATIRVPWDVNPDEPGSLPTRP